MSGNVISLYAKGLTTGEIQAHLEDIYDTTVPRETISKSTDQVVGDMVSWQNRPLDGCYPVLLIDPIEIEQPRKPWAEMTWAERAWAYKRHLAGTAVVIAGVVWYMTREDGDGAPSSSNDVDLGVAKSAGEALTAVGELLQGDGQVLV